MLRPEVQRFAERVNAMLLDEFESPTRGLVADARPSLLVSEALGVIDRLAEAIFFDKETNENIAGFAVLLGCMALMIADNAGGLSDA